MESREGRCRPADPRSGAEPASSGRRSTRTVSSRCRRTPKFRRYRFFPNGGEGRPPDRSRSNGLEPSSTSGFKSRHGERVFLDGKSPANDSPAPADDSPAPADDSPAPANDSPAPADDSPAPADDSPAPADDSPAPADGSPAPANDSPAPADDSPAPADDSPAPADGSPASASRPKSPTAAQTSAAP